jgi:hypothetical protein
VEPAASPPPLPNPHTGRRRRVFFCREAAVKYAASRHAFETLSSAHDRWNWVSYASSGRMAENSAPREVARLFVSNRMRFFLNMLSLLFAGVLAAQIFRTAMSISHNRESLVGHEPVENIQSTR